MTTKQKIFNTAVDLFSRKGFRGVSIREITRAVGIKESSLYNHFKNKEEILKQIFDYFLSEYEKIDVPDEAMDEIITTIPPDKLLKRIITIFKEQMETATLEKIFRILSIEQFSNKKARDIIVQELISKPIADYEKIFSKMMAKNLIKQYDPKILAVEYHYPIYAMIYEYTVLKYDSQDTSVVDQRITDHINYFYATIRK